MPLRIVQLGSPRAPGEGLRIGTVRRPPRGVPKGKFASRDYYGMDSAQAHATEGCGAALQRMASQASPSSMRRAMITRMISFVPSRIWCTRASRIKRSSGYSRI